MKTMKTKIVAIMLVLALALTGCVTQKSTVVINSDGSAKMTTNIKVDKAFISGVNPLLVIE